MAREVGTEKLVNALAESVKPRLSGSTMPLDAFQVLDVHKVSFVTSGGSRETSPKIFSLRGFSSYVISIGLLSFVFVTVEVFSF